MTVLESQAGSGPLSATSHCAMEPGAVTSWASISSRPGALGRSVGCRIGCHGGAARWPRTCGFHGCGGLQPPWGGAPGTRASRPREPALQESLETQMAQPPRRLLGRICCGNSLCLRWREETGFRGGRCRSAGRSRPQPHLPERGASASPGAGSLQARQEVAEPPGATRAREGARVQKPQGRTVHAARAFTVTSRVRAGTRSWERGARLPPQRLGSRDDQPT